MPPYCSNNLKTCYEIKTPLTFCLASLNGDVIFRYNKKIRVMKIYTVIVFMSGGDIDWNDVKSFTSFGAAESYGESLGRTFDIIPNKLEE